MAAFLNRETAMIDGLVAEKQRLMKLLKEKRQAGISRAVTKGLPRIHPEALARKNFDGLDAGSAIAKKKLPVDFYNH